MAKTVAVKTETTTETVVTKATVVEKTYADGVQDTMDKVLTYLDGVIETNRGVGYIHALESIRDGINNINN
jgi:hypothetical protein